MNTLTLETIYKQAQDITEKEIDGQLMITLPSTSGGPVIENAIYMINHTGCAIWKYIDGKTPLKQIIENLSEEYHASKEQIRSDVNEMIGEFMNKNLILEV